LLCDVTRASTEAEDSSSCSRARATTPSRAVERAANASSVLNSDADKESASASNDSARAHNERVAQQHAHQLVTMNQLL
jgi:hypothetical protein